MQAGRLRYNLADFGDADTVGASAYCSTLVGVHWLSRRRIRACGGRIGAELRKYLVLLTKGAPKENSWDFYQDRRRWMRSTEPGPGPDQFQYVPPDENEAARQCAQKAQSNARKALTRAVLLANDNHEPDALEQWRQASLADPSFTDNWTARLRKTIRARQRAAVSPT